MAIAVSMVEDDAGLRESICRLIQGIRSYIRRIYEKLHVNCRTDAVVKYLDATNSERRPISRAR